MGLGGGAKLGSGGGGGGRKVGNGNNLVGLGEFVVLLSSNIRDGREGLPSQEIEYD